VIVERRAVVFYDRAMRELRRIALASHDAALVATAGDDAYVLARAGRELDLLAIDRRGVRWREAIGVDRGGVIGDNGLDAGPEGPFVYGALELTLPGASGRGEQIVALARDGSVRWRQPFDGGGPTLVADRTGGAYVITDENAAARRGISIHHLDPHGHTRWTQSVAGAAVSGHRLAEAAALTHDGGVALAGMFTGAQLAAGERGLHAARGARSTSYLAILDEQTGAAMRLQAIGDTRRGIMKPAQLTAMPSGELAVTGVVLLGVTSRAESSGSSTGSPGESSVDSSARSSIDTMVALVGPAGISSAIVLAGTGDQVARAIVASDDGSVWLSLTSFEDELFPDGAALAIGSQRFAEQGLYVLNLVP
jgi:hypothetical protein